MGRILRDIYADVSICSLLGFKGGTCVYFIYGLPRFSVDLDFDLFETDEKTQMSVYEKLKAIVAKYGKVKDSYRKRFTIFFLLSYGDADRNIKVEVNVRPPMKDIKKYYELKEYLGISMLVGKKDYLFAAKLAAVTQRRRTAMRDIYDSWYFAKESWDINAEVVKARTGKTVKEYLADCIRVIEAVKNNQMLQGLGELLDEKDKAWVKNHLQSEAVFMLKNYMSVLK